jgi:hypothetical protein
MLDGEEKRRDGEEYGWVYVVEGVVRADFVDFMFIIYVDSDLCLV